MEGRNRAWDGDGKGSLDKEDLQQVREDEYSHRQCMRGDGLERRRNQVVQPPLVFGLRTCRSSTLGKVIVAQGQHSFEKGEHHVIVIGKLTKLN